MEPIQYDYSWDDLSKEEGIVIQKCTVYGADIAWRSPQFADWIHIETDNGTVTVLNGYDPKWNHDESIMDYQYEEFGGLLDCVVGFSFLEMLKEYDGVFIDMAALNERYEEWDGEGEFDVSDLVKPYTYY
jgi:hypothetical protein